MTTDITFCNGDNCSFKLKCKRYVKNHNNLDYYSCFSVSPIEDDGFCEYFIELINK